MKVLDSKIRQVQSLYTHVSAQVSCSEISAMKQLADCSNATGGGGGGSARDVVLDWRADPFVSLSDLTLNVYTSDAAMIDSATPGGAAVSQQQQQLKAPTVYYTHTLLMAYGGRKSNFIAEQIRNQRPPATARQHASSSNSHRGGKGSIDKLILTESIVGRAYDKVIHRQNSNTSYSSGSSFIESSNNRNSNDNNTNNNNSSNHNNHGMGIYKVDIHLPPLAAYYLPLFLDYIYGSTLTYTTNNAVPLRYLANRFDTRELYTTITNTFISCDLTLLTSSKYISMADILNDYEMRDCVILYLAQRLHKLSNNDNNDDNNNTNDDSNDGSNNEKGGVEILACLEPRLLRRILQCDKLVGGSSEEISILVAKYLQMYTNRCTSTSTSSTTTTTTTNNNNNNNNTTSNIKNIKNIKNKDKNNTDKHKDKDNQSHSQSHSEEEDDIFWSTYAALEQKKVSKWESRLVASLWHWVWGKDKVEEAAEKRFV